MNSYQLSVKFASCFILFLGVALVFYAVFYGVGLTNDSRNYLFAAQSFSEQGELLMLGNKSFTEWTPLFPIFLSIFGKSAMFLNTYIQPLIFGLTLFIWTKIISKLIKNKTLQIICFASIALATPLILIHSFLWSEGLFLLLLSLQILLLYEYLKTPNFKTLVYLTILGFFYCLQRNTGVFFSLGLGLSILFFTKKPVGKMYYNSPSCFSQHTLKKTTRRVVVRKKILVNTCLSATYLLFSSLGFLLWNVRSYFIAESNFESGGNLFIRGFWENFYFYTEVLTTWFLPAQIPFWLRFVILMLVFVGLLFLIIQNYRINFELFTTQLGKLCYEKNYFLSISLIAGVYLIIMLLLRPSMVVDIERFLSLIYPFIFVLLFTSIDFIFQKKQNSFFKKIVIFILIVWLIYPISRTLKNTNDWHINQLGIKD